MEKVIDRTCIALKHFCVACLGVLVVFVFTNVVLRYLFHSGITLSEELSRWVFVWMVFMGAVIALRDQTHLGTEMVVSRLPAIGKKICRIGSLLIMTVCIVIFIHGSWRQFVIAKDISAPVSGLSTGIFYGVGLVFGAMALFILLESIYRFSFGKVHHDGHAAGEASTDTFRAAVSPSDDDPAR